MRVLLTYAVHTRLAPRRPPPVPSRQLTESERFRFLLDEAPAGTRVLVGYQFGGYVTDKRPPSVICGERWSYPSTFYRFPDGEIHSGDAVDAARIPRHTLVFFRQ